MRAAPDRRGPTFWPDIYEDQPARRRGRARGNPSGVAATLLDDAARRLIRLAKAADGNERLALEEAISLLGEGLTVVAMGHPSAMREIATAALKRKKRTMTADDVKAFDRVWRKEITEHYKPASTDAVGPELEAAERLRVAVIRKLMAKVAPKEAE